jgi:hypothetical protein
VGGVEDPAQARRVPGGDRVERLAHPPLLGDHVAHAPGADVGGAPEAPRNDLVRDAVLGQTEGT